MAFEDLGESLTNVGRAITAVGAGFGGLIKRCAEAHYHLAGQHTFPLKQQPVKPRDVSTVGQVILFPVPVVSWVASLTVVPLIGNSIQSAFLRSKRIVHASFKGENEPFQLHDDQRSVIRRLYGLPGEVIGCGLGLVAASFVVLGRMILHSARTCGRSFVSAANLLLPHREDRFHYPDLSNDDRHGALTYLLGGPGFLIGVPLGLVITGIVGIGRFFKETFLTSIEVAAKVINRTLPENKQVNESPFGERTRGLRYGIGCLGFVFGGAIGVLTSGVILLARGAYYILKQSAFSFAQVMKTAMKAVLPPMLKRDYERRREGKDHAAGVPGLLLGIPFAAVAVMVIVAVRWIGHTLESLRETFKTVMALSLPQSMRERVIGIVEDNRDKKFKYGVGCIGVAIGGVLGAAVASVIGAGRILINVLTRSFRSMVFMAKVGVNAARVLVGQDRRDNDYPHETAVNTLAGIPGLILGAPLAVVFGSIKFISQVISQSFKSAFVTIKSMAKLALPAMMAENWDVEDLQADGHTRWQRYGLGGLGVLIGVPFGLISMFTIGAVRTLSSSVMSAYRVSVAMVNKVLSADSQIDVDEDTRNKLDKYAFGAPGYVIGSVLGLIAMPVVLLGRLSTNIGKSFRSTLVSTIKSALHQDDAQGWHAQGLSDDPRSKFRVFGVGLPGVIAGAVVGGVIDIFIILGRVMRNSFYSAVFVTTHLFNFARPEEDQQVIFNQPQTRFMRYGLGLPGVLIGGVIACLVLAVKHSAVTLGHTVAKMVRGVLHPDDRYEDLNDNRRPSMKYVLGIPGGVLGAAIGAVASGAVLVGRLITNNLKSLFATWWSFTRAAILLGRNNAPSRAALPQWQTMASDERHPVRKYVVGAIGVIAGAGLGIASYLAVVVTRGIWDFLKINTATAGYMLREMLRVVLPEHLGARFRNDELPRHFKIGIPGCIIGAALGLAVTPFIALGRTILNSVKTARHTFISIINTLLHLEDRRPLQQDQRDAHIRYGFGFPGLIFGSVAAIAVSPFLVLGRIGSNIVQTAVATFVSLLNPFIGGRIDARYELANDQRNNVMKFGVGGIGVVLGVWAAIVPGIAFLGFNILKNTAKSWLALSRSLMNVAIGRTHFHGIGEDDRVAGKKAMGGLGYILAMVTTVPIAAMVWIARKVPIVLGLALGLSLSPFVAAGKAIYKALHGHRFDEPMPEKHAMVEGGFKNLCSSLNYAGKFEMGFRPLEHRDGKKGKSSFVRKAVTANTRTATERCLDAILEAYRDAVADDEQISLQNFFTSAEYAEAVAGVKQFYKPTCVNNQQEKHAEIDRVATYIRDYLTAHQNGDVEKPSVPNDMYRRDGGLAQRFLGRPRGAMGQDELDVDDLILVARSR